MDREWVSELEQKPTLRSSLRAYVYLLPMFAVLLVFTIIPVVKSFSMAFYTDYDFFNDIVYEYGIDNFRYIAQDGDFHIALKNTFVYVLWVVPLSIVISLGIALLLNQIKILSSFFRTLYFLPYVTSTVAIAIVWNWIYHSRYGLLNYLLGLFGIDPVGWLVDPKWTMTALVIMSIWKGLGFNIILFLVGLKNISPMYYKAAQVDGAKPVNQFFHITLPLLSPTTFLVSMLGVINGFKVFTEVYVLFQGQPGPSNSCLTVVYYLYQKFYTEWKYGIAAASGIVLFVIILVLTIIQNRVSKRYVHY